MAEDPRDVPPDADPVSEAWKNIFGRIAVRKWLNAHPNKDSVSEERILEQQAEDERNAHRYEMIKWLRKKGWVKDA